MSLRTAIWRRLEAGEGRATIVSELHCHPATVDKVMEALIFDKTVVSDVERARRNRVAALTHWELRDLAKVAEIDPTTLRRVLMGLPVRPSSLALTSSALARKGLSDLLPPASAVKEGAH